MKMKKCFSFLMVVLITFSFVLPALAVGEDTICIVPEDFKESLGTFIIAADEKGSGFAFRSTALRGTTDSNGENTIPAQVNIEITEPGTYAVWVRTRDYDTQPGRRYFKMAVDKKSLTETEMLGAHKENGWKWEKAGETSLEKGVHTVKVYDTSAFYARLDMIVVTQNAGLSLPETEADLQKMLSENHMKQTSVKPEVPLIYKPNQVFRPGFFYTAFGCEAFAETGSWQVLRNQWSFNGETPSKDKCFLGKSDRQPQNTQSAKLTFAVPNDGDYYIWARSRDFANDQGTRLFQIAVDGADLEGVYGDHGIDGWAWERKTVKGLKKGYHTFELKDSFAFYARCDYFLITNDSEFVPLSTKTALYKLLGTAAFAPETVVPEMPCPVAYEEIAGGVDIYPLRPTTEYAVRLNGKYIGCLWRMQGNQAYIAAEPILKAIGFGVQSKTDAEICFVRGEEKFIFITGDCFAHRGKQKIEMRAPAEQIEGQICIPVSFLNKLEHVQAAVQGKDAEITHRIWK